jgi:hypothetical protein
VVLFGIMRFNFAWCDERVKGLILEGKTPLGRILIENNVLRRISTHVLLRIAPNAEMRRCFGMGADGNGPEAAGPSTAAWRPSSATMSRRSTCWKSRRPWR